MKFNVDVIRHHRCHTHHRVIG